MKVSAKRRLIAQCIDTAILLILGFLAYLLSPTLNKIFFYLGELESVLLYTQITGIGYYLFFYTVTSGSTIGRMITNHRVVKADGSRVKGKEIIGRSFMQAILILLVVNAIYQILYKSKQSIFGLATNTICINIKDKKHI